MIFALIPSVLLCLCFRSSYGTCCRAIPRTAADFTGLVRSSDDKGPGGALLLCVTNTRIPCKAETQGDQRGISFTVLNVRDKGWIYAPW